MILSNSLFLRLYILPKRKLSDKSIQSWRFFPLLLPFFAVLIFNNFRNIHLFCACLLHYSYSFVVQINHSIIVFYNFFGLTGLGYAFLATYVVYLFQVYFISKSKWNFEFDSSVYKIFLPQLAIALITLSVSIFFTGIIKYTLGTILICISVLLAFKKLNMLLDIKGKFKALLR